MIRIAWSCFLGDAFALKVANDATSFALFVLLADSAESIFIRREPRVDFHVRCSSLGQIDFYVDHSTSEQQSSRSSLMRTSMGCSIGTGATNYRFTESLSSRRWTHSRAE